MTSKAKAEQGAAARKAALFEHAARLMRLSGPRRAMLAQLASAPMHCWSAAELAAACCQHEAGSISTASVYRNLLLLQEQGLVQQVAGQTKQRCFRLAELAGAAVEFLDEEGRHLAAARSDAALVETLTKLAREAGFELISWRVELRCRPRRQRGQRATSG